MSSNSAPTSEPRLGSWKEIATHLERDVRTVQRWEKSEGLPVHRHVHGKRGTVFAYRSELDAWLVSRTQAAQAVPAPSSVTPAGRTSISEPGGSAELEPTPKPEPVDRPEELTDPGSTSAAQPAASKPRVERRRVAALGFALVAIIGWVGSSFLDRSTDQGSTVASGERTRLVVLPFHLASSDGLAPTAGHGLHEELITRLAGLAPQRMAVIGRTSSLRYADGSRTLAEIGRELSVRHAIEGSLRTASGVTEATIRLVRTNEEDQLWSRTFRFGAEAKRDEEGRIAREVAEAVGETLFGLAPEFALASTTNMEAHAAWLRGRYLWHKGTTKGFLASIEHYHEALGQDSNFVAAHVGLADSYNLLGRYGNLAPAESFPLALEAAERALNLDPDSAEAHAALGAVQFYYQWDFRAASQSFHKALQLAPGLALSHHLYGHFLSCMGLHEEALKEMRRAQALEPFWTIVAADAGWFHYRARDYQAAVRECRKALTIEPDLFGAVACLVASLEQLNRTEEAWEVMRSSLDRRGLLARIPGIGEMDAESALKSVTRWTRDRIEEQMTKGHVSAHSQVFTLMGLGRGEELLQALEAGHESRDRINLLLRVHPNFDDLREEPRFKKLEAAVGFLDDPRELLGAE